MNLYRRVEFFCGVLVMLLAFVTGYLVTAITREDPQDQATQRVANY